MRRSSWNNSMPICEHHHTQEHVHYSVGYGETEYDDGSEGVYEYTLRHRILVCVHCLFMLDEVTKRVVFLVFSKGTNRVEKTYNLKEDAEIYAKTINGWWSEAEVVK